jgi:hypothetical protein
MLSVSGRTKKDATQSGRYRLETRLLVAFAEAVRDEGLDEPEDSTLEWVDGQEYNAPLVPRGCHSPAAVVASLVWLRELARAGEDPSESVWLEHADGQFTAEAFSEMLARDLEGLLAFCDAARDRGDKVVGIWVP